MENIKNLKTENGVEKLKELVKAIDICLFCTNLDRNYGGTCRPMSAQEVDDEGNIWFEEGKDDPDISLLKVSTKSAYYWDTDGNRMVNFFKFLASVATGSNLVTGVQGSIKI